MKTTLDSNVDYQIVLDILNNYANKIVDTKIQQERTANIIKVKKQYPIEVYVEEDYKTYPDLAKKKILPESDIYLVHLLKIKYIASQLKNNDPNHFLFVPQSAAIVNDIAIQECFEAIRFKRDSIHFSVNSLVKSNPEWELSNTEGYKDVGVFVTKLTEFRKLNEGSLYGGAIADCWSYGNIKMPMSSFLILPKDCNNSNLHNDLKTKFEQIRFHSESSLSGIEKELQKVFEEKKIPYLVSPSTKPNDQLYVFGTIDGKFCLDSKQFLNTFKGIPEIHYSNSIILEFYTQYLFTANYFGMDKDQNFKGQYQQYKKEFFLLQHGQFKTFPKIVEFINNTLKILNTFEKIEDKKHKLMLGEQISSKGIAKLAQAIQDVEIKILLDKELTNICKLMDANKPDGFSEFKKYIEEHPITVPKEVALILKLRDLVKFAGDADLSVE